MTKITKSKLVMEAELNEALRQRGELEESSQRQDEIIQDLNSELMKLMMSNEDLGDSLLNWRVISLVGWLMVILIGLTI